MELEVPFLVDSGAGATFIDHDTYVKLGSPPYRDSITVSDVSNTVTTAHGIGPLGGYILDASGAWVPVLLAKHAYPSEAFGLNLFSVGEGLKAGWDVSFTKKPVDSRPCGGATSSSLQHVVVSTSGGARFSARRHNGREG